MKRFLSYRITRWLLLILIIVLGWGSWKVCHPPFRYVGVLPAGEPVPSWWSIMQRDPWKIHSPDGRFTLVRTVRMPLFWGCGSGSSRSSDLWHHGAVMLSVYDQHHLRRAYMSCVMYWPDDTYYYTVVLPSGETVEFSRYDPIAFSPDSRHIIIYGGQLESGDQTMHTVWAF